MNYLARKDFFICLGVWLALEIVCFIIFPALPLGQAQPGFQLWFLLSLLFGVGGAILTAGSTQLDEVFQTQNFLIRSRLLQSSFRLLLSWLGLLGIGFPLLVMSVQLFGKIFELLKT